MKTCFTCTSYTRRGITKRCKIFREFSMRDAGDCRYYIVNPQSREQPVPVPQTLKITNKDIPRQIIKLSEMIKIETYECEHGGHALRIIDSLGDIKHEENDLSLGAIGGIEYLATLLRIYTPKVVITETEGAIETNE